MLSNSTLILESLKDKKVFDLVECAMYNGDFKKSPAIAGFLTTSVLNKNYSSDQDLLKIINNVVGDRPLTLGQLTSEEKVRRRRTQVAELLRGKKIGSYLDYGCGNGKITRAIVETIKPEKSFGTDIMDQRNTNEEWNFDFQWRGSLPEKSFDLITCFTVLHHIDNIAAELRCIKDLLKDSGVLIIREFCAPTDEDKLFNYVMDEIYYKGYLNNYTVPIEMNYYSKETWMSLFLSLGFKIVSRGALKFKSDEKNPYNPFYVILKRGKN